MLTTEASRVVYDNPWVTLREDRTRYPDGAPGVYTYMERPRFAIAAAIEDGRLWMVEQWRHPLKRRSWELPMGVAPGGDAVPAEEAARVELREETGVTAARWRRVGAFAPAPGLLAQYGELFLAEGLTLGAHAREQGEQDMVAEALPVANVLAMARDGRIVDGVTLASLGLLALHGLIPT